MESEDDWGELPNGPARYRYRSIFVGMGDVRDRTTIEVPAPEDPNGAYYDLSEPVCFGGELNSRSRRGVLDKTSQFDLVPSIARSDASFHARR